MCFSSPSIPAATPMPTPASPDDVAVQAALDRERKQRALAQGKQSTMLTGASGLNTPAPTAKTLLGS